MAARTSAVAAALLMLWSSAASAQAARTWVSGIGDDVNPCSRTAPCKTFAGALVKTSAGGEISVLDPGGYGTVTITKSITIDGGGGQVAGVTAAGSVSSAVVINAPDANVILRNITLFGNGTAAHGVRVLSARQVHLDDLAISGFATGVGVAPAGVATNVLVERSRLTQNTVGLSVDGTTAAATVRLSDSTVLQNGTGLATAGGGRIVSYGNNRLRGNGTDGVPTTVLAGESGEPVVTSTVLPPGPPVLGSAPPPLVGSAPAARRSATVQSAMRRAPLAKLP